jgi:hypothetical protein
MTSQLKTRNEKSSVFMRVLSLFSPRTIIAQLRSLDRDAAIDSARNVLMVIGLGVLIGDFATMKAWFTVPAFAILAVVWYADYLRHDFTPFEVTVESGAIVGPSIRTVEIKASGKFPEVQWCERTDSCFSQDRTY